MRTFPRRFAAALVAALALLAPSRSDAAFTIYGTTLINPQLISVDPTAGTGTLIGPAGSATAPFGLAAYNNQLYTFDQGTDAILRMNAATGATTQTIATTTGAVLGQGGFAISSTGVAYLTSALDPSTYNLVNDLFQINLATGVASSPLHTSLSIEALAFSSNNTLYALDRGTNNANSVTNLYTVNTTTGVMTLIGSTGVAVGSPTGAMAFSPTGTLYATLDDKLYTLNLTTGAAAAVGSTDPTLTTGFGSISGLAILTSVPEPSSFVLLATGAAAIGFLARRRIVAAGPAAR